MRLRESIKKSGFTLKYIAKECNLSRISIFNIDKGITSKNAKSVETVLAVFKKKKIKLLKD